MLGRSKTAYSGIPPIRSKCSAIEYTRVSVRWLSISPQHEARELQTAVEALDQLELAVAPPAHPDLPEIVLGELVRNAFNAADRAHGPHQRV